MVGSVSDFLSFTPCADLKALKDAAVLISMDQLAGQCTVRRHTLPKRCDKNHLHQRPNIEKKRKEKTDNNSFVVLRLSTAVKSKMILSFQYGRERKTASPPGPTCSNRVFRRPLSGCHNPPNPSPAPLHHPRPRWMNSSQADVRWGDEGCDTDTECTTKKCLC